MSDQPQTTADPFPTIPELPLEALYALRDHYWARSNAALDRHDAEAFTLWNRRAKQVTMVIATAQEVWIKDREAWVSSQAARLAALDGKASTGDE